MATKPYTKDEWKTINATLDSNPDKYGFPNEFMAPPLWASSTFAVVKVVIAN